MDVDLNIVVAIISIAVLGVVYFIFVKQDGTVLLSLCSVIGGLVGYGVGRRRRR